MTRTCLECKIEFPDETPMLRIDEPKGWICRQDFLIALQRTYADLPQKMGKLRIDSGMAQMALYGAAEKTWEIKLKEQGIFK